MVVNIRGLIKFRRYNFKINNETMSNIYMNHVYCTLMRVLKFAEFVKIDEHYIESNFGFNLIVLT